MNEIIKDILIYLVIVFLSMADLWMIYFLYINIFK